MISFRFHIVSITAVFLAIAIGVVVGTTYVDGAVVDVLRNRIDSVEKNLDDRKAENDRLEGELGLASSYIDASAPFAVTNRLTDVPVLVVATRGIDEAAVEGIVALTRVAGGRTPGVVWLEAPWDLESDDDRAALAEIIDGDPDDTAEDLTAAAWTAVADELTAAPVDESATGTASTSTAVLAGLAEAGFLSLDELGDGSTTLAELQGIKPRVLVVTGARAEPGPAAIVPTVTEAAVDRELVTVVADVHVTAPEAPGRAEELLASLSPEVLEIVAIVDNADRTEGQVGSVLALDAGADGPVGHLGYGEGADGVLPAWTPP
jgi:hypothetical protein